MNEKLNPSMGIKKYIDDFKKSDAPQFQGKSDSKRKEMAIAAYLDAKKGEKKEDCWDGYKRVGMKKKGDKMVPNCVPESTIDESMIHVRLDHLDRDPRQKKAVDLLKKYEKSKSISFEGETDKGILFKVNKQSDVSRLNRELKKFATGAEISEAVNADDTGGAEEVNMAVKQIAAMHHFLDGIEARVKKEGDMEEWYQNKLTKANDYLKTLYSYGKGSMAEEVEQIQELTAREKEMMAKRKAARLKKKTPSAKAGKDASRDGAGRQAQKNKSFVPKKAGAGTGKSKGTEHLIMQLRKAQDVDGNMDIEVSPKGKKVRLKKNDIDALLKRHDSLQKPRDKRLFRVMLTRKLRKS